ncbi:MAG: hypothetical protein M0Q15_10515 [Nevskia sp.]|jgi:hypothetical protein|nr:hypothetical protein [Nevskia sp.]
MSYTVIDQIVTDNSEPPIPTGETVVELDTGARIALLIRAERVPVTNNTLVTARARQIDDEGTTVADVDGTPIMSEACYTAPADVMDTLTISRELARAALGEPLTLGEDGLPVLPLSSAFCTALNIRHCIAVSAQAGVLELKSLI